jgi:hypothetical protein
MSDELEPGAVEDRASVLGAVAAVVPLTGDELRMRRAYDRARDQIRRGVVPVLIDTALASDRLTERWVVPSATRDNLSWVVDLARDMRGMSTSCTCEAAQRGQLCWHRAAARLAHMDVVPVSVAARVRYRVRAGVGPPVW